MAFYAYYSPDYFRPGVSTLYLEANGVVTLSPDWRVTGNVGLLTRLTEPGPPGGNRLGYDWRLGLNRTLGSAEVGLAISGGGPSAEFYRGRGRSRTAVTASMAWSL